MGRKCFEIFGLEVLYNIEGEFGLSSEGIGLASIIASMSEFLTHKSICIMAVVGSFCEKLISFKVPSPFKAWPTYSSNRCMRVPRFACVEVGWVIEKVPFYCTDYE